MCPSHSFARWRRKTGFLPGGGSRRMGGDGIARRRSNGAASTSNEPDRAASWDRVLYRKQAFPDNHTDDTFLSGLVLNGRITPRVLSEVMLDATTVSQQLAVVALKSTAVAHLLSGRVTARDLVAIDAALLAAGALAVAAMHGPARAVRRCARVGPAMLAAILALTPLFQTMTAAISDDTAVATAVCSLALHLLTHDYASLNSSSARLGSFVSLGAAMFASAILTSRLPPAPDARSPLEPNAAVFADMTLAVALFVLLPSLRREARQRGAPRTAVRRVFATACLHAAAMASVLALRGIGDGNVTTLAVGYVAAVFGIVVVCPAWLVRMMGFKEQINGPWDEAKPDASLLR